MAITVKISTEKTKKEKHTLLKSLIRFWPIGSVIVVGFELVVVSFMERC